MDESGFKSNTPVSEEGGDRVDGDHSSASDSSGTPDNWRRFSQAWPVLRVCSFNVLSQGTVN